ncbi:hypothetical protein B9G69_010780 [Bdellovibrio sp. SKB1291214]|uniref:hypothetical protein n=1 Tax=Bdellovibrio sp. SKB1291214 TaxID=1732569 RepID=UPI0020CD315B|nr:hypothetical protein [Bdellovibrio sp. SKB1291214]UYL07529.1 hypothetical protein B9G69_010780 [Bdellovibrio sp. SKB1291214]
MRSSYTTLMQSKYFNPAFNSAIFDGPVRIYFAQFHEALALKVYFMIQQQLPTETAKAKEAAKASGANILVMIYPTADSFQLSFENAKSENPLECEKWGEDVVIGTRGPLEDENLQLLIDTLRMTMENWKPASLVRPSALQEL